MIYLYCWLNVDRTRRSQNHYKFSTPGPYDCRYPPPTLWKYHFCRSISLLVSRRRSNAIKYGKQTTSLPKTIFSLISNVYNNIILLYWPLWLMFGNVLFKCIWPLKTSILMCDFLINYFCSIKCGFYLAPLLLGPSYILLPC